MLRGTTGNRPPKELDHVWSIINDGRFNEALSLLSKIKNPINKDDWHLAQARCLQGQGKPTEALKSLSKIKDTSKKSILLSFARCHEDTGHYDLALQIYNKLPKTDTQTLVNLARCYENMGRLEDALTIYPAIPNKTKNTLISFARCYQRIDNHTEAIKIYHAIPHKDQQTSMNMARCYQEMNLHSEALKIYCAIPNPNKEVFLSLARCYAEIENYVEAESTFKKIVHWENDKDALLGLARCFVSQNKPTEAIKWFQKITGWKSDTEALLGIARCYQQLGQYDNAIPLYIAMPNKYSHTFISFARCYEEIGQYDKAIEIYCSAPKVDKQLLISHARCYEDMGKYHLAEITIHRIFNWRKDKAALLNLARCYQVMGQYDDALVTYNMIPYQDSQVFVSLALCYEEMGRYEDAVNVFSSILHKDKPVLLSLARSYAAMGRHEEAILIYDTLPKNDKDALLGLARCYEEIGNYLKAEETFKQIQHWHQDREALLGLARCYEDIDQHEKVLEMFSAIKMKDKQVLISFARYFEKMNQCDAAIQLLQTIPNWKQNKDALLSLARCYEKMGSHEKTWDAYNNVIKKFPYYQDAYYQFCRYVVDQQLTEAETILAAYIEKWPYMSGLYLLKALHADQQKNTTLVLDTLNETIKAFPYCVNAYIALIRHHIFKGNIVQATQFQHHCLERFKGHYYLLARIETAIQTRAVIRQWGESYSLTQDKKKTITLPEPVKSALRLLSTLPTERYVVGSIILSLLNQESLHKNQDVDLTIAISDATPLKEIGFVPCPYDAQLYTTKLGNILIDCYVTSNLSHDTRSRDFTIACLYSDERGTILDPSGHGLNDAKNKILRTVGHPQFCFQKDPVRLLRAIKYIVSGYTPTPDVHNAMINWTPDINMNLPHLYAVAKKHLSTLSARKYVEQLKHYGLLNKIFGIAPSKRIDVSRIQLEQILGISHHYQLPYPLTLFPRYADLHHIMHKNYNKQYSALNALDLSTSTIATNTTRKPQL